MINSIIRVATGFADEMKEMAPDDSFLDASGRMTEAWQEMVKSGQLKRYLGLNKEDIDMLTEKGSLDKEDEYIVQYLTALQDILEVLKG